MYIYSLTLLVSFAIMYERVLHVKPWCALPGLIKVHCPYIGLYISIINIINVFLLLNVCILKYFIAALALSLALAPKALSAVGCECDRKPQEKIYILYFRALEFRKLWFSVTITIFSGQMLKLKE